MQLRLRKGPHPAVTEHHARLLQDAHPSGISPIRSLDESCRLMHRRPRKHHWRHTLHGFAFKRSHSGNRTAICILTSYAFRQNNCCSIAVLRCRPMKLITACRTPQVSLPNMATLFLPRKSHRQDIIRSKFHSLFKGSSKVSSGLLARVDRIGRPRFSIARPRCRDVRHVLPQHHCRKETPFFGGANILLAPHGKRN